MNDRKTRPIMYKGMFLLIGLLWLWGGYLTIYSEETDGSEAFPFRLVLDESDPAFEEREEPQTQDAFTGTVPVPEESTAFFVQLDPVDESSETENPPVILLEPDDFTSETEPESGIKPGKVYVKTATLRLQEVPDENSLEIATLKFGAELTLMEKLPTGYSHVCYFGADTYEGYVRSDSLATEEILKKVNDQVTLAVDTDVLDYPSRRDGNNIGELLAQDTVSRIAVFNDIWSRVLFMDSQDRICDGYILTSSLQGYENVTLASTDGMLHQGAGTGIFAEAVSSIGSQTVSSTSYGVLVGTPQAVPEKVTLKSMGVFKITHYCQCSICCGPYADGITAIGTTAITNHTIAVSPSQIPYGSLVVINGQVYVAEDCGGAIKTNCIDIYVASHEEALAKGVFYTEVYVIQ